MNWFRRPVGRWWVFFSGALGVAAAGILVLAWHRHDVPVHPQVAPTATTAAVARNTPVATVVVTDHASSSRSALTFPTPNIVAAERARMDASASTPPTSFTAIQFLNADDGWVGGAGVVGSTTNGGATWSWHAVPGITPNGFAFTSATSGWLTAMSATCQIGVKVAARCDTVLMRTTDGGATWTQQDAVSCGSFCGQGQIEATDSQHARALVHCGQGAGASCGGLVQTSDGGSTWSPAALPAHFRPQSVDFVNDELGWVSGSHCPPGTALINDCRAVVEHTTDGGRSWHAEVLPTPLTGGSISFVNAEDGFLVPSSIPFCAMAGCWVGLYATTDGGQTWSKVTATYSRSGFPGLPTFVSPTVGFVPVQPGAGGGVGGVARTTDGGHTWTSSGGINWGIEALSAVGPNNIWAIGSEFMPPGAAPGFLVHSTNGGRQWAQVLPPVLPTTAVDFLNNSVGFAIGMPTNRGAVLTTTDGGAQWTALTPPGVGVTLQYVTFANNEDGWVAGTMEGTGETSRPVVFATTNGGHSWHALAQPPHPVVGLSFSDAARGWMATDTFPNGGGTTTLWLTSNGGRSWSRDGLAPTGSQLMGLWFSGKNMWAMDFVASHQPACFGLLASSDGGAAWSPVVRFPFLSATITADLIGPGQGWVIQSRYHVGTTLLYTDDGGRTWIQHTLPEANITDLDFMNPSQGWLLANSALWRTADGGLTWARVE